MRTAEEILYSHGGAGLPARIDAVKAMKEYATQVAEQVLKDAAERATMTFHDGHFKSDKPTKHHQIGADNLQVNRDSILSTPVLTP